MNQRPARLTQDGLIAFAVYVADDVLGVGRIELGARESLQRVAYRDVTRMIVWDDGRVHMRFIGAVLLTIALALASLAAFGAESTIAAAACVSAGLLLLALCLYGGRLGAVTRFRLETAYGEIDAALGGNRDKRQLILWDIEQRVLARQDVSPGTSPDEPALFAEADPFATPDPFLNPELESDSDAPDVSPGDAPAPPPS